MQTSRLFVALEFGEQLAHKCAVHQASRSGTDTARKFLQRQARQEVFHAKLFKYAANWLKPRHIFPVPSSLKKFGNNLERAMKNKNSAECLVASQIVLEGFGEQILLRLNKGMDNNNIGFKKQRELILQQEQSHYNFGLLELKSQVDHGKTSHEQVQTWGLFYLQIIDEIVEEMSDIFLSLDENADEYKNTLLDNLPDWLYVHSI